MSILLFIPWQGIPHARDPSLRTRFQNLIHIPFQALSLMAGLQIQHHLSDLGYLGIVISLI